MDLERIMKILRGKKFAFSVSTDGVAVSLHHYVKMEKKQKNDGEKNDQIKGKKNKK